MEECGDDGGVVVVEDGESTDAESENSNDDLNVHQFLADLEAEFEKLQAQADLDHTDGAELAAPEEDEETMAEDLEETLGILAPYEGAGDEETERELSDAEAAPPPPSVAVKTRRRLRGKQRPPAAYQEAPEAARRQLVHKGPAILKRPSSRIPWPNETCEGYRGATCRFDPLRPGKAARVHPERGAKTCMFCSRGQMQKAHAVSRPVVFLDGSVVL